MMHVDAMRLGLRHRLPHESGRLNCAERQRGGTADQEVAAVEARLVRKAAIAKRKSAA
jgi:hypothetical protein